MIFQEDTFVCVEKLVAQKFKPVALDFASGSNPGGSWRSKQRGTQEESLCRRSNLGLLLEKRKYPIPYGGLHYVSNVIVNKDVNLNPIKPFTCAVIASELRSISETKSEHLQQRLESLFKVAIDKGHDVLVLGAWGCGAFKESDDDIVILAREFKKFCDRHADSGLLFVFAITGKNYKLFVENFV